MDNIQKIQKLREAKGITDVAFIISSDWKNVYFGAVPYLQAMRYLINKQSTYGSDSASSIVNYFLSNASGYRGEVAKEAKLALKRLIK